MMKKALGIVAALVCWGSELLAQASGPVAPEGIRAYGMIGVVATVLGVIFAGIVIYLIVLDRKISALEKELKD